MTRVVVHPASDLSYASFILEGLAEVVGSSSVVYSTKGFDPKYRGGRVLAFYLDDDPDARCFVSLHDHARVNPMGLHWARAYGMVNVSPADVDAYETLFPIGPTFGIRMRSRSLTLRHLTAGRGRQTRSVFKHERRRTTIDHYIPRDADPDYVFFAAWAWAKHPDVNPPRARFVDACRHAPGLEFEGGFAPRRQNDLPDVVPFSAPRRYSIEEYLDKLSRSAVAFNSPAVHGCLGWKLGEFLALGKAIITTPVTLALPADLEPGVHVHLIDGSEASIEDALDRIRRDDPYRRALQTNARRWYDEHLAPARVANRLLDAVKCGPRPPRS